MPPYRLVSRTELATTETLCSLLEAHQVADEVDAHRGLDEDARWRRLMHLLPWIKVKED